MRLVNKAETWEKAYTAFQQINFAAWDYNTIKESMLDFLKLYHPEDFKDYIESSEFIALVELFAYLGELIAYRLDMNAHENFLQTAERKESVLRLAKLISYNPSRNIPGRGIVKVSYVSTSERVFDSRGVDLSNRTIKWNDPINPHWKEQFILVMNRLMSQDFGSVSPSDRVQVQDVVFELYALKNIPIERNVLKYTANANNESFPMEIVPVALSDSGPTERRPERDQKLNIMYLNDGLGDASENTGFFLFTKQGELQRTVADFDGITPNQTFDITVNNCNETDVWVNNINPDTGMVLQEDSDAINSKSGAWSKVDVANAQNVIFNTNPVRTKYEVETLDKDRFRLIFGDGNFANIPSGRFEIWYRVSANADVVIPTSSIQDVNTAFGYLDGSGREQTATMAFSLVDPIQNAAPSEDIERIKRIAPAVYYTQDRMVNGRDYNEFMLQDNTILKLRAINRTFAGDSKYIAWHDPREYYDNVKLFGNDLTVYFNTTKNGVHIPAADLPPPDGGLNVALVDAVIKNHIIPILGTEGWFVSSILNGVNPISIRKFFKQLELLNLKKALYLLANNRPATLYLTYNATTDAWTYTSGSVPLKWNISIAVNADESWDVTFAGKRIVVHSDEIKFWINNDNRNVITPNTLKAKRDQIVLLKSNVNSQGNGLLARNYVLNIMAQELLVGGEDAGTESIHDLHVIPEDRDANGFPDDVNLAYLIPSDSYVYFRREAANLDWVLVKATPENIALYQAYVEGEGADGVLWKRESGVYDINFLWLHRTPRYHLVDPATTNLIDMFVIPRGYYILQKRWLSGKIEDKPEAPSAFQLRNDYGSWLQNKMISDTVILHPGKIKVIIGKHASDELKGVIKIIRTDSRALTGNQIKTKVVDIVNEYFDINNWEFGEPFYFSKLASYIHGQLPSDIASVVFVPTYRNHVFGDLMQVVAKEDEIIQPSISVDNIELVESLNPRVLKQNL